MAPNLNAMASNFRAMASNLVASWFLVAMPVAPSSFFGTTRRTQPYPDLKRFPTFRNIRGKVKEGILVVTSSY